MYKTLCKSNMPSTETRITVNTETLAKSFDCGRATAVKIGEAAGAKIQIGKRVLWNVKKIQDYLDSLTKE